MKFAYLIFNKKSNERKIMKFGTHFKEVSSKLLQWKTLQKIIIIIYFFSPNGRIYDQIFDF